MKCPTDGTELVMTERSGVEIDYCPQCRGVWLDRGELDKILDRVTPAPAPQPSAHPGYDPRTQPSAHPGYDPRHQGYGGKPYKKKREGFLGELFDF